MSLYPDTYAAMWAYIAGDLKDCSGMLHSHDARILGAIGGAVDPDTIRPVNHKEACMLKFAKNLAAMRAELEELRAAQQRL